MLTLTFPDNKKYVIRINLVNFWLHPGWPNPTGWTPLQYVTRYPKLSYNIAYPTGDEPIEHRLFAGEVEGNGPFSNEIVYSPPFVTRARYRTFDEGAELWIWNCDSNYPHALMYFRGA